MRVGAWGSEAVRVQGLLRGRVLFVFGEDLSLEDKRWATRVLFPSVQLACYDGDV